MSNINSLYDKKIIWLADYNICGDNFNYFKNQLITILRSLKELDKHVIESLNNIERDLKSENSCLLYVRFVNRSNNIRYYSVDDYEVGDDTHLDALETYQDFIDNGYQPLVWSDLIGSTTDTYDIFDTLNESFNKTLIGKQIWFDFPTERNDIEKVNQFLIDNGYRGLMGDNIDEFEDFIYDHDVAYFSLTQHDSPLHSEDRRKAYVDYSYMNHPDPYRLKAKPNWIYYKDILEMSDITLDVFSNLNESTKPTPKAGDFLYCHKDVIMDDDDTEEATAGKLYPIQEVSNGKVFITNNSKTEHTFSTDSTLDWYYGIWFHLVPKEHKETLDKFNAEDIFNQLN